MPLFPGERPLTAAEATGGEFTHNALVYFWEQTGLRREQASFSAFIHTSAEYGRMLYFVARPFQSVLGPTQQRYPDPNRWWIYDADVDESEGWRAQGALTEEGLILFNGVPCGGGFVIPEPPVRPGWDPPRRDGDDEGDAFGAPPPRPVPPETLERQRQQGMRFATDPGPMQTPRRLDPASLLQQRLEEQRRLQSRLPHGNSSVRDAVMQMRDLKPEDATYADDADIDEMMPGNHFMRRTASSAYVPETSPTDRQPQDGDPPPAVAVVDHNARPLHLTAQAPKPKSVYDYMNENLKEMRADRPAPSVWDRLKAQRKGQ